MNGLFDKETQLDRIEAKLDKLLERKKKPVENAGIKSDNYDDKFNSIWSDYPFCTGANKKKAYAAYKKRLSETSNPYELSVSIHAGVRRYAELCAATGRMVMLPATFFGPSAHYDCDWTIPASARRDAIPKNDADLEAFAVKHGLHKPGCAPQNIVNMGQYREWIKERI